MIKANNPNLKSWLDESAHPDFPIQNIPFGAVIDVEGNAFNATRIGNTVINLHVLQALGYLNGLGLGEGLFDENNLNDFIATGKATWRIVRNRISELFEANNQELQSKEEDKNNILYDLDEVTALLPVEIKDYTDFYSSKEHATNVGTMFRDPANALLPNWLHIPVGYHGRASSIIPSGQAIHRPNGQTLPADADTPTYNAARLLDFELEMAFITGQGPELGEHISIDEAEDHIFGLVVFNDWSARDIQKWEYVPLGPFLAKNFASSISTWIVTLDALEPFKTATPDQSETPVLPYLEFEGNLSYDINLAVDIKPENAAAHNVSNSNFKYMYWNMAQQLAHHTVNGCNVNVGDMMGSGTISGPNPSSYGSMLEIAWKGTKPVAMPDGSERKFINDHDTVIMRGWSEIEGYPRIGFGDVSTYVHPAKPLQKGKKKANSLAEA
jgi:fumarylacetoacetase